MVGGGISENHVQLWGKHFFPLLPWSLSSMEGQEALYGKKNKPHQLGTNRALRREMARRGSPVASGRMPPTSPLNSPLFHNFFFFLLGFNHGGEQVLGTCVHTQNKAV